MAFVEASLEYMVLENWLYVVRGKDQGRRFEIGENKRVTIGREKSNSIRLIDEEASRHHAFILNVDADLEIRDLNSSNGTFVNGERVATAVLKRGDQIDIGQTSFLVGQSTLPRPQDRRVESQDGGHSTSESLFDSSINVGSEFDSKQLVTAIKSDLKFMYHAALATSHASEVKQMLEKILDLVFEWLDVERACILLWNEEQKKFETRATRFRSQESRAIKLKVSKSLINFVIDRKEGILTSYSEMADGLAHDSGLMPDVREIICVPIRGRSTIHGFIYGDTIANAVGEPDAGRLNDDHLKLMVAIGFQVAAFIENNDYYNALVKSERLTAVGQTLSTLSHHVKNILQSINGGTHLIEDGLKRNDVGVIEKGWGIVKRNQRNMSNLVMDMVSFSKPSTPHRKACRLEHTLQSAIRNACEHAGKDLVVIKVTPNEEVDELHYDEALMTRAFENVVNHILDCARSGESGKVEISYEIRNLDSKGSNASNASKGTEGPCLVVNFQDDFQVLSDQRISMLFEPFAFESENDVHGIGLAVTRKILKEHSGDISVRRRKPKGVAFRLYFPVFAPVADHPTGSFDLNELRELGGKL